MSAWDGLLGQIWSSLTRIDIGKGINFTDGIEAVYNSDTGLVDVRPLSGGGGTATKVVDAGTSTGDDVSSSIDLSDQDSTDFLVGIWVYVSSPADSGTLRITTGSSVSTVTPGPAQDLSASGAFWIPTVLIYAPSKEINTHMYFQDVVGTVELSWRVVVL